jgi:hypothetical protein
MTSGDLCVMFFKRLIYHSADVFHVHAWRSVVAGPM